MLHVLHGLRTGDEVWFSALGDAGLGLHAVTLSGRDRIVWRSPNPFDLDDIAPDGRVLLTLVDVRVARAGLPPGATTERDLSWFAWTDINDLAADGASLLFYTVGNHSRWQHAFYWRRTDGSPAIRLGEGSGLALSADGKWVLAINDGLIVVPTGPGQPRSLPRGPITRYLHASWFPDGQRVAFSAQEADRKARCYVQDVNGGLPRPITPEGDRHGSGTGIAKRSRADLADAGWTICGSDSA